MSIFSYKEVDYHNCILNCDILVKKNNEQIILKKGTHIPKITVKDNVTYFGEYVYETILDYFG